MYKREGEKEKKKKKKVENVVWIEAKNKQKLRIMLVVDSIHNNIINLIV